MPAEACDRGVRFSSEETVLNWELSKASDEGLGNNVVFWVLGFGELVESRRIHLKVQPLARFWGFSS